MSQLISGDKITVETQFGDYKGKLLSVGDFFLCLRTLSDEEIFIKISDITIIRRLK